MLISFLRAVLLYLVLVVVIRLLGKRQLGEMEPSEFVVTMLIADLAAVPMQDIGIPLLTGIGPILTVLALELMLSALAMRSLRLRRLLCGAPVVLVEDGRILARNLRRTRITVDELLEMLRQAGTVDPRVVWQAILETNGQLSVLLYPAHMPATAEDAGIPVAKASLPVTIISDGRLIGHNLSRLGRDRKWLEKQLQQQGLQLREVFLFTAAPDGTQYWIPQEERE